MLVLFYPTDISRFPTRLCGSQGPMCRLGRLGDSSGDFALGFSSKCTACTCRSATGAQRTVVPITTWDDTQVYYHLHISKTGGTTLEHIVQQLVRHPASPAAMTVCKTEKHPFSHPPLFADPKELERSGCNVITAEGRMRFIEQQLPYVQPHMLILLRHPVLRTLSQFRHDLIQESTLANKEWRTPYTGGFSSLKELYKNTKGVVHKRYRDWQSDLLYHPNITFPDALENMTFIGITDFYKTTMCLFYFTFQIPSLLDGCQERPLTVYNKACQGDDCERFQNTKERHVRDEDNHKRLNDALSHVDTEVTRELIEEHTRLDQALYDAALDLFWRRVAVMEQVVGEQFHDLPDEYRLRITRLPSDPVFEPL
ncbi:hypothetical protein PTSG_07644 [Salpingoeca rosetta]|uniref:Sulfotransferase domain-containing protein n=1 Tax=Salpingoeca rosetta (strain ATCC 50818 / BSB-021) TaxID=946362 RepID=F2UHC8_SALR5|nr:uncharacterized protein PTSG_07644 [Salpingoeca rosetta]EGD76527.1 hypothetical protein PTSG_07644 [Salpingoeca rosetta]|eukprot:XP_004991441.1 hypothetical protein PTSG_07644 [Salpingoeca rosetta]